MNFRLSLIILSVFLIIVSSFNFFILNENNAIDKTSVDQMDTNDANEDRKTSFHIHPKTRSGGITFTNVTPEVGLSGIRGDSFAWGDYNNDGYQDLLVKDHIAGQSHLFKNNGPPNWDFTDVTEKVGIEGSGYAVWGDYNNDGFLDFFSVGQTNDNPDGAWDTLWMNNGPPDYTFINMTGPAGNLNDEMPGLAAGWADYDRDGFLDLYVVNWRDLDNIRYPDVLYHNNGDGTFTNVTVEAGVWEGDDPYAGMGVNWGDYNNDGWPDIYVSNYLVTPNYLYENNGDGTFSEVAHEKNAAGLAPAGEYYGHTAGSSWCDYDHDGDLDMWVSNLAHTTDPRGFYTDYSQMLRNNGPDEDYTFTDVRDETGIEKKPYMSEDELHFGIAWGDYDNDGDMDMFIPQVKNVDYAYSYFFENNGDGTFTDVSDEVGVKIWNTDGACWADYNNDGFIDLTVEGQYPFGGKREIRLFRNNGGAANKWLEVELVANESNLASIGARVKASYNGITQMKELEGGTAGHAYQHSLIQHFGFGNYDGVVDIEVWWPSGEERILEDVSLNQKVTISAFDFDPVLSEIWVSNQEPYDGDVVTITATIQNAGRLGIDSLTVIFYDGDINTNLIGLAGLNDLSPGEKKNAEIQWDTTGKKGSHTITVLIEDVSPKDDCDLNNMRSKKIEVKKYVPDIIVSSISFSDQAPEQGDTITITAKIQNFGNIEADSAMISFFDGDIITLPIGVETLYDIPAGHDKNAQIQWDTTGKKGSHTITVLIEDVVPEEENTQNNLANGTIEVKEYEPPPQPPPEQTNHPPVITEFTAEPDTVLIGGSCTLTVYAEDADGDDLTYSYKVSNGVIVGQGDVVLWYAPEREGVYVISVTVKDMKGAEVTGNVQVEVIPNSPPDIQIAKVSSNIVYSNGIDTVLFTAEVNDKNGLDDIDQVRIDLSEIGGSSKQRMHDDGGKGDEKAGDGIYSYEAVVVEGIEPGEKTIRITVMDKSGGESTKGILVFVRSTEEEGDEDLFWQSQIFLFLMVIVALVVAVVVALVITGKRSKVKYR